MPTRPMKPCRHPGCPNTTHDRYCDKHSVLYSRASASERGYNSRWRNLSKMFLKAHPLCVACKRNSKLTKATVVDHIKPHRGDKGLFWDESNWQPLCKRCHDTKTMTEDRYKEYTF